MTKDKYEDGSDSEDSEKWEVVSEDGVVKLSMEEDQWVLLKTSPMFSTSETETEHHRPSALYPNPRPTVLESGVRTEEEEEEGVEGVEGVEEGGGVPLTEPTDFPYVSPPPSEQYNLDDLHSLIAIAETWDPRTENSLFILHNFGPDAYDLWIRIPTHHLLPPSCQPVPRPQALIWQDFYTALDSHESTLDMLAFEERLIKALVSIYELLLGEIMDDYDWAYECMLREAEQWDDSKRSRGLLGRLQRRCRQMVKCYEEVHVGPA
ncbi:hypothetical protein BDZ91DRAFT_94162 [Kalaharituber pfeilii]|nr:hypothetical protein BDZ91DRAFT_94162 [Kalaharituber pfeilii]